MIHIHGVFDDKKKVEECHVLGFVNHNNVFFGNVDAWRCIMSQNMADTGVGISGRIIIFDGKTVIGVDIQIGDVELIGFFFDFVAQHGVVSELYEFFGNHFCGDRENGGGFTGAGDGINDRIVAGFCIIKNNCLFFTCGIHMDTIYLTIVFN